MPKTAKEIKAIKATKAAAKKAAAKKAAKANTKKGGKGAVPEKAPRRQRADLADLRIAPARSKYFLNKRIVNRNIYEEISAFREGHGKILSNKKIAAMDKETTKGFVLILICRSPNQPNCQYGNKRRYTPNSKSLF